jgi:hypothetical protein
MRQNAGPAGKRAGRARPFWCPGLGQKTSPRAGHDVADLAAPALEKGAAYGSDDRSGVPVVRLTGIETCSCTINQPPLILRYTSVTRVVRSMV